MNRTMDVNRREFCASLGIALSGGFGVCWELEAVAGPILPKRLILRDVPWGEAKAAFVERRVYRGAEECEAVAAAVPGAWKRGRGELLIPFTDLGQRTRFWDTLRQRQAAAQIEIYRVSRITSLR